MNTDEPLPKRARISIGEALAKLRELDSALGAAEWVLSEFCGESEDEMETKILEVTERLKARLSNHICKQRRKKKILPVEELQKPALTDSMVNVLESKSPAPNVTPASKPGRPPAESLDDVTLSGQRIKLKPIIDKLTEFGQEMGGKTPTELCGRIVQLENYTHNRKISLIGKAIYDGTIGDYIKVTPMGEAEALFMKTNDLDSSDRQYRKVRSRIGEHGLPIPSLSKVKEYEIDERYALIPFEGGFRASLVEITKKRLTQIMRIPEVQMLVENLDPVKSFPLKAEWNTGFDGSGGQITAMQSSRNASDDNPFLSQQNRETVVAVLKGITTKDNLKVFATETIGAAHECNIYMLIPAKENRELMKKFLPIVDDETEALEKEVQQIITPNGKEIPVQSIAKLRIADGKGVKESTGLGGAYCMLGTCSKEDGQDINKIRAGFKFDRSMEQVAEIYRQLYNEERGTITKSTRDYSIRQGVTNAPLTVQPIHHAPHPLHDELRMYNFFQKLMYKVHYIVESEKHPDVDQKELMAASRLTIIEAIKDRTGIVMDTPTSKGGTTDTGNAAERFFSDEVIPVLKDLFPNEWQDDILKLHKNFSIILRVIKSTRPVDTEKLQPLCQETYLLLREKFPMVIVTETTHMVLGHSFQLIDANDGYGLGQMTEQGLESVNKLVKRYSERFARQISLGANITDVMHRLQVLSNPYLKSFKKKSYCTKCKEYGQCTISCPEKDQVLGCNTMREQLKQDLHDEVESYLH